MCTLSVYNALSIVNYYLFYPLFILRYEINSKCTKALAPNIMPSVNKVICAYPRNDAGTNNSGFQGWYTSIGNIYGQVEPCFLYETILPVCFINTKVAFK